MLPVHKCIIWADFFEVVMIELELLNHGCVGCVCYGAAVALHGVSGCSVQK